ncbi:hypothetical protein [Vibrio penaeicida]|uniref:hypothetical protein n=1 Tax=Vibrio penaeicida TaxID=104609 RepID=UPI000F82F506|nr:hypothetical protein [Vibrio penaeicida]RTZ22296.1 hypothetical protein EKN09_14920 [Vibrio penaeicida]
MLLVITRYGEISVSRHAVERWRQRTGRSLPQLVVALSEAKRPTKNRLRRIMKCESGWQPKRILESDCAYFLIRDNNIVTVYEKRHGGYQHGYH